MNWLRLPPSSSPPHPCSCRRWIHNQLWNSARAIASSVAFIHRLELGSSSSSVREKGFLFGERWDKSRKCSNRWESQSFLRSIAITEDVHHHNWRIQPI